MAAAGGGGSVPTMLFIFSVPKLVMSPAVLPARLHHGGEHFSPSPLHL